MLPVQHDSIVSSSCRCTSRFIRRRSIALQSRSPSAQRFAERGGMHVCMANGIWWCAGKKLLESQVEQLESEFPGRVKGIVQFSAKYAHLITAGALHGNQTGLLLIP